MKNSASKWIGGPIHGLKRAGVFAVMGLAIVALPVAGCAVVAGDPLEEACFGDNPEELDAFRIVIDAMADYGLSKTDILGVGDSLCAEIREGYEETCLTCWGMLVDERLP